MKGTEANFRLQRGAFEVDVALSLPSDRVTALLGPSGSGKTTVLRALAGLERPQQGYIVSAGQIWFDARRKVYVPPQRRRIGLVFQDYALFDHLSVAANIGYGLPRRLRAARSTEWLQRLQLTELAGRYPHQLSGGQRQRVALGRAMAPEPDVLLLDEPFSAIDASLRHELRRQLREVIVGTHRPVLIVTHDLDEARNLADRVCVMAHGRVLRSGDTREVFDDPQSRAAAQVLGWRNLLAVNYVVGQAAFGPWGQITVENTVPQKGAWIGIRPEHIRFAQGGIKGLKATVVAITEQGAIREIECRCVDGMPLYVQRPWDEPVPAPGSEVQLVLAPRYLRCLSDNAAPSSNSDDDAACLGVRRAP